MLRYVTQYFTGFLQKSFSYFYITLRSLNILNTLQIKVIFFLLKSGGANMFSFKATNEIAFSQQFILSVRLPLFSKLVKRHVLSYTLSCATKYKNPGNRCPLENKLYTLKFNTERSLPKINSFGD